MLLIFNAPLLYVAIYFSIVPSHFLYIFLLSVSDQIRPLTLRCHIFLNRLSSFSSRYHSFWVKYVPEFVRVKFHTDSEFLVHFYIALYRFLFLNIRSNVPFYLCVFNFVGTLRSFFLFLFLSISEYATFNSRCVICQIIKTKSILHYDNF